MVQLNANRFISRKDLAQKKKRSPYIDSRVRKETFLTRQMNACVRCRMQRNRCIPDPTNPTGPCKPCQEKLARMTRLPCLRYKVTDSILFRTGLDYMPFYKRHPMNGPTYGDFHINKEWVSATTRLLDITQDRGPVPLTLEVREFKPPSEENALDLKGRSMYYIPWAIVDAESAVRAVNAYADANVESYLDALLDDSNHLVWDVFHAAIRLSVFPTPNKLLRNVLRLWVVCRFIESGWRVCGNETLNAETLKDPFYDWISPPPYIDYQFASTVIQRVLEPLRLETLRGLQTLVLSNKPSNWYQIFLVSFILLHNYELQVLFQRQFAARRKAKARQRPFREDFDWKAPQVRKMAQLDTEQSLFMERSELMGIHGGYRSQPVDAHMFDVGSAAIALCDSIPDLHQIYFRHEGRFSVSPASREWPGRLTSGLAWDPSMISHESSYTYSLTATNIQEIENALESFKSLGLDGCDVRQSTFPLPTLGESLLRLAIDVHCGKGFINVRGLNPENYSPEDNILLFLGLSSYIGEVRARQDEDGNMLMHICDAKRSRESQQNRPIRFSSRASTFHTDTFCDILALQTRSNAARGGRHIISSSYTIYNKIAAIRPDLLEILATPNWSFDSRGELFECNSRSLLHYHGGNIILNLAREPLLGLKHIPRTENLPELLPKQREALDLIETFAQEGQLILATEPGDLTFINNHALLHSREAFEDSPEATRYLVRMWLKNKSLAWKLPRSLQIGNSRIYDDNELGNRWNVVAVPKLRFKLSERLSS
ncbi:hypothetical protein B0J14DRAFT_480841 [Halenospora varia]|nr:hypothetical protein B0J14DRAFT_480841 [Halenospora varia]